MIKAQERVTCVYLASLPLVRNSFEREDDEPFCPENRRTPPDILARLNTAFNVALKSAPVSRKMGELHLSPLGKDMSPAQFTARWEPKPRSGRLCCANPP